VRGSAGWSAGKCTGLPHYRPHSIRDVNKAGSFKAKAKSLKAKAKARKFGLEAKAKARDQG